MKLGYGLLLSATLIVGLINSAYHFFLLLAVELLLPVFLLFYLYYGKHCLTVELWGERHSCTQGEKVPLSLELRNNGIFPIINAQISLRCQNRYLPREHEIIIAASVMPGKTQVVDFLLTSEHCGQLDVVMSKVTVLDPFSLLRTQVELGRKEEREINLLVLPVFSEEETLPDRDLNRVDGLEEVFSLHQSGDDPSEVFAIREYRPGDRQRQIHWKLSLKQRCLMVREFSLPLQDCFMIFIDFNVKSFSGDVLSLTDSMLERALSLSYYLQNHGIRHSIAWFDMRRQKTDSISIADEDDFYRAIRHLFALPLYEGEAEGKKWYQAELLRKSPHSILYFAPRVLPDWRNGERSAIS